ncbi:peptide/nickel transport system substrate-binding protein [Nocardiopsis mwathae]|uniref:Peptide/nickel transport system substrate-binding protein n=1 Tax=Nocardiopsis mwathae TaxID=1472723 RepID=A0A7W9YKC8_9ACTN|nr:peptide/nickel transport system substrate-binding protein [Nocardiopsis mwathae]
MLKLKPVTGLAAALTALALTATACTGGNGGDGAVRGWEDCEENPNTCNSGERGEGGEITWVINSLPGSWNLISPEGGSVYTNQMLEGILPSVGRWAPDGETYEHDMDLLAEEPELIEEDPFTFQFKLRPEAVWNDGTPITADDFEVTWKMAASPEEGHCDGCRSRAPGEYDDVEKIEGTDDGKTVTVTLKDGKANAEWFGFLDGHKISGGLYPAHLAEEQGLDVGDPEELGEYFDWLNETMPEYSGGPYKIVDGDLENQVIKEPNENWYGEIQPTLDKIIMRFNPDEGTWIPALTNGEIHGANPAQYNDDIIEQVKAMDNVYFDIGPGASWEHIDFNTENEWLEDVELRRAIFTAIDVGEIAERNFGAGYPDYEIKTNFSFAPESPYHRDVMSGTGQGTGDTETAEKILTDAGYEIEDGTLTKDGEKVGPFRLRSTDTVVRNTSLQIIQSHLSDIGVETNIEVTDDLGEMLGKQDYDIVQFGWSGSPFFIATPFQQWHSSSGSNFGKYENEKVDELVEKVLEAKTLDEAAELTNQAQEVLVEDAYVLPIMDEPAYAFVTEGYVNIRDNRQAQKRAIYNMGEWGTVAQ